MGYEKNLTNLLYVGILTGALLGTIVGYFATMASDDTNFSAEQRVLLGVCGIFIVLGVVIAIIKMSGISKK